MCVCEACEGEGRKEGRREGKKGEMREGGKEGWRKGKREGRREVGRAAMACVASHGVGAGVVGVVMVVVGGGGRGNILKGLFTPSLLCGLFHKVSWSFPKKSSLR